MADNVKKIFKSDIIGKLKSELVSDNKIKGVFGEVNVNFMSDDKEVWQGEFPLSFTNIKSVTTTDLSNNETLIKRQDRFTVNGVDLDLNFSVPTYIKNIRISLEYIKTTFYFNRDVSTIPNLEEMKDLINGLPADRRNLSVPEGFSAKSEAAEVINIEEAEAQTYSLSNSDKFSFRYNTPQRTLDSKIYGRHSQTLLGNLIGSGNPADISNTVLGFVPDDIVSLYPTKWIITLIGTELMSTTVLEQIGEQTNALELPQNSLVTTKAKYKDTSLFSHLANKIINEWHGGKQTVQLSKVINDNSDLIEVDDTAVVLNAREADFNGTDINAQSIARKRDGTAKEFKIDSAEFRYDGSFRQIIDMSEKTTEDV